MPGISILNNWNYLGKHYDFDRQGFTTIEAMKNFSENYLPPVYLATNEEDGGVYLYNVSNEIDDTTGKWRPFSGSGSSADMLNYYNKTQTNTLLDTKVDKEQDKGLSTNDFTNEYMLKLDDLENYDDTEVRTLIQTNADNITTINTKLGTDVLQTTAQTVTSAINELKTAVDDTTLSDKVTALETKVGNASLTTTAQTLSGAVNELKAAVDDTTLADRVTANEEAIALLNDDDTVVGSVDNKVASCLQDAKDYTDEQIDLLGSNMAIACDAMPVHDGNGHITYVKNGVSETIDEALIWFYYVADEKLMQSMYIDGQWKTIVSAGGVDFDDFVSKTTDVVSTYTGTEVNTSKIPDIGALQALQTLVNTDLNDKVAYTDIEDSLTSTSTVKVLSANQGKVIADALDTKLDNTFTGANDGNKALQTDALGVVTLVAYDDALSNASSNAVKNSVINAALNTKLDKVFTGNDVANKALQTDALGEIVLGDYDDAIDATSTNAVQNTVIASALDAKLDIALGIDHASKVLGTDANGDVTFLETSALGNDAENVSYTNAEHPTLTNVKLALDAILAKLYYVEPNITSFTMTPATAQYEIGTTVNSVEFTWTVNKDITSQTLTDCTLADETVRTATYSTAISSNKTFTLAVSDGENSATASKTISFLHKVYWGSATEPSGGYTSAWILALSNSKLASSNKGTYSFNAGSGEYAYFAVPSSMKPSSAWVNGFNTDLEDCGNISFTNASGNTSTFSIVRFMQKSLGSFTAEIK